jgi:riboflavin kinase / FMN adenylyltransferase
VRAGSKSLLIEVLPYIFSDKEVVYLILHQNQSLKLKGSIIAIGAFDGVHKGHQYVISQAVKRSETLQIPSVIYTFDPPPRHYFQGARILTTLEEKIKRIEQLGVDHVIVARFDHHYLKQTPEQFMDVIRKCNSHEIHVGKDFRFGQNREGDVELLKQSFHVETVSPVYCEQGTIISSTRIRKLVEQGKNHEAMNLLGLPFSMKQLTFSTPSR